MPVTSFKILVIGDACIDEYRYGSATRLNPEAPVPILNIERSEERLGMAFNVAANIQSFGVQVSKIVPRELSRKIRYVDLRSEYQLLRVDQDVTSEPCKLPPLNGYDAVVISDYNKGFVTAQHFAEIAERFSGPVFVDTKKFHLPVFENFTYKINELENANLDHRPDNLIVTLGSRGCVYQGKIYEADPINVVDVCGAGDVFLAALAFGYLEYKSIEAAIRLANRCAGISCKHQGSYTLTKEDIRCAF